MSNLRYLTAGESHGEALTAILEGMPSGLAIDEAYIAAQLHRRQQGYGRGGRMRIEKDFAKISSGVRFGKTIGSPISLRIDNLDWKNWQQKMRVDGDGEGQPVVTVPRPGHADLPGAIKYQHDDLRNVLERASARETTARVAVGAIARKFLKSLGVSIASHVTQIHDAAGKFSLIDYASGADPSPPIPIQEINDRADASPVRCLDEAAAQKMIARIDEAKEKKDTVGGIFEVAAFNVPIGLGSHVQWDRRLDTRLSAAMMSIQAIKGVEVGEGFHVAGVWGSAAHDEIYFDKLSNNFDGSTELAEVRLSNNFDDARGFIRKTNRAGGIEGGISNGEPVVVRVAMKPLSTLMRPLASVDIKTKEAVEAHIERSDVCAVPAAAVIGEAMMALIIADAFLEKFGGDSMKEIEERVEQWRKASF
jgi:chorismate synthase